MVSTAPATRPRPHLLVRNAELQLLFDTLWRVSIPLAACWWALVVAGAALPPALAAAMGALVSAVSDGVSPTTPLAAVGLVFVAVNAIGPVRAQVGAVLGARTESWLNDVLIRSTTSPAGIAHLEDPQLAQEFSMARDFELGLSGTRLREALSEVGNYLSYFLSGAACVIVLATYRWWAGLVLAAAWMLPHVLLRNSAKWRDWQSPEVQSHQRAADYTYRLAVDPASAKETRTFGLAGWIVDQFTHHRRRMVEISQQQMRLRVLPLLLSLFAVAVANVIVFGHIGDDALAGRLSLDSAVTYAGIAVSASALSTLMFRWWLDAASRPVPVVTTLASKATTVGGLSSGELLPASEPPQIHFRNVSFAYPAAPGCHVVKNLDLEIPAGSSLAIVGQNGAGKTTLAKLLCRFYDPESGHVEANGIDLREFDLTAWRGRIAAIFQDFIKYELPLRDNVAPQGGAGKDVQAALSAAGVDWSIDLNTVLSPAYPGGTDLSGGQWQRIALARALYAIRSGAGVLLLDEPTAQLDVRSEAAVFDRILQASRGVTTILVSHRFSTVRHADRICVVEGGRVIELGSHDELMNLGGRYRTMFDLQAARFVEERL